MYEILLTDSHMIFSRPKSTKQSQISYKLDSFQCIMRHS